MPTDWVRRGALALLENSSSPRPAQKRQHPKQSLNSLKTPHSSGASFFTTFRCYSQQVSSERELEQLSLSYLPTEFSADWRERRFAIKLSSGKPLPLE